MRGRGGFTPRGMRGGVRGVVRGGVHMGRGTPNGMRGRGVYTPRGRGQYTPRGRGNYNNSRPPAAPPTWKLQCFFCTDTVSTGKLNRNYYKLHLEAVHNISLNVEKLLNFTLSQQNVGEGGAITAGASPLTAVANILSMKGITIQRTSGDSGAQSSPREVPGAIIPETLINIKGITVQRVNDGSSQPQHSPQPPAAPAPNAPSAAQMRQQEQAINRWANGCEHGCRLCKQKGKNFVSFNRQGLLKHLEQEHEATERDYKEEFKCINLITRASNMTCKECGNKVKRIPTSLNIHLKRHGLNLRSYWLKHLKPGAMLNKVNGNQGRPREHVKPAPAPEGDDNDEIEMEMELDPTAMLEVGIGDEPLEVELPEDADDDAKAGLKHSVNSMLGENGVEDGDVKSEPGDEDDPDYDQLNTPEAIDIDENDIDDGRDSDGNKTPVLEFPDFPDEDDTEEVVNIDTPEPSVNFKEPSIEITPVSILGC